MVESFKLKIVLKNLVTLSCSAVAIPSPGLKNLSVDEDSSPRCQELREKRDFVNHLDPKYVKLFKWLAVLFKIYIFRLNL